VRVSPHSETSAFAQRAQSASARRTGLAFRYDLG
jgi:hypothetical protein